MPIPEATPQDYTTIQGGMPTVTQKGGLTEVHHNYPKGKGIVVSSHKSVKEFGEVTMNVDGVTKRFKIALLRLFHGEPCEARSRTSSGGGRYPRKK